jgi:hypothetical protein
MFIIDERSEGNHRKKEDENRGGVNSLMSLKLDVQLYISPKNYYEGCVCVCRVYRECVRENVKFALINTKYQNLKHLAQTSLLLFN